MWASAHLVFVAAISLSLQNAMPAMAQQNLPATKGQPGSPVAQPQGVATVAATQPVITVHGICDKEHAAAGAKTCARVITREEFETLMTALNPDGKALPPNARRNLAKTYADYLAVDAAVRKAGMEDSPELRLLLEWTRLRTVSDFYRRSLQEKYRTPSPAEIDAYYQQHQADFERVRLVRILVPRQNPTATNRDEVDRKARSAAETAQQRAVKGDDPAEIQKDTYAAIGLMAPPPTDLGNRRRVDMVAEEAKEVFALKPGEVTPVETEINSYVIYKVLSKDTVPLEEAKADISREIYQQKFREAMKPVLDAAPAEFNEQYFGSTTPASVPATPATPSSPR